MEQCPICKKEFDPCTDDETWLVYGVWLCGEECWNTFEGNNIERDIPEEFEPPDYLDDPEEEETEDDEEGEE